MFRILNLNQQMLSIAALRLRVDQTKSSAFDKFRMTSFSGAILTLVVSSFVYSLEHSSEIFEFVEAFYVYCIFIMFSTVYINFALGKATIKDLLEAVQHIVEIRMAQNGQEERYKNTEKLMDLFTVRYYVTLMIAFATCFIVPLMVIVYHLVAGSYSSDILIFPYKMALPFDQKTPLGYAASFSIQCFIGVIGLSSYLIASTFYIGISAYVHTILSDIEDQLRTLFKETSNYVHVMRQLNREIQLHAQIYDILGHACELMQGPIFIIFLSCLGTLCTTLFLMQTAAENFNYIFIQLVLINVALTSFLFLFCIVGTTMTDKCICMADAAYDVNWFQSSIDQQRYIILILARSQKPFYFHGYKIVKCSLMSFKSVMNMTFSFFMLLRKAS